MIRLYALSFSQTLYFSRIHPNLSEWNNNLGLINHWIIMKFEHQVQTSLLHILTVGFCEIIYVEGEISLARRKWKWGFNPFSFSLTLENPSRAIRGKFLGILGNRWRCRYHCRTSHIILLRGKGWVYRN